MEISSETLQKTISEMSEADLLKRWKKKLFSDIAMPIAEAEIIRRKLDSSEAALAQLHLDEQQSLNALKTQKWSTLKRGCLTMIIICVGSIIGTIIALIVKTAS